MERRFCLNSIQIYLCNRRKKRNFNLHDGFWAVAILIEATTKSRTLQFISSPHHTLWLLKRNWLRSRDDRPIYIQVASLRLSFVIQLLESSFSENYWYDLDCIQSAGIQLCLLFSIATTCSAFIISSFFSLRFGSFFRNVSLEKNSRKVELVWEFFLLKYLN